MSAETAPLQEAWGPAMATKPRVWIACPRLGADSQPWIWRQIRGLQQFDRVVLAGEWLNPEIYPVDDVPVLVEPKLLGREPGPARWWTRARGLPRGNFLGLRRAALARLRSQAQSAPPDVLLGHFGQTGLRLVPLARALGVPLVAHFHGLDLSSSLKNRWYRWSLHRTLTAFSAAIVVGSHQRERLVELGFPRDRITWIPCGVPVEEFNPAPHVADEDVCDLARPVRFVTVSRLVPQKGVHIALEAFERLVAAGVQAELHVVGEGPERTHLEARARELKGVHFYGSLPQAEVVSVLRSSDVFLQHSIEHRRWVEGFGVSVTEASACALPVVVSRSGGLVDQVVDGTTGFVVPEGDVAAMTARMHLLALNRELRVQLGRAGRKQAELEFDLPRQIRRLERVLLDAIEKAPRR